MSVPVPASALATPISSYTLVIRISGISSWCLGRGRMAFVPGGGTLGFGPGGGTLGPGTLSLRSGIAPGRLSADPSFFNQSPFFGLLVHPHSPQAPNHPEDEDKGDPDVHSVNEVVLCLRHVPDIFVPRLVLAALDIYLLYRLARSLLGSAPDLSASGISGQIRCPIFTCFKVQAASSEYQPVSK